MAKFFINYLKHFDVNSETIPQALLLVLREQIRDVFSLRDVMRGHVLSNKGIDVNLNEWWKNHKNIIRAASLRPEWDWTTLSLKFDKNVERPVDLYKAKIDYAILLAMPTDASYMSAMHRSHFTNVPYESFSNCYLGELHQVLYNIYFTLAFYELIAEEKEVISSSVFEAEDGNLSIETASKITQSIQDHVVENTYYSKFSYEFSKYVSDVEGEVIPFNKLPKALFNKLESLRENGEQYREFIMFVQEFLIEHERDFVVELYKSVGAHQIANGKGALKTTILNKLVKSYYDWLGSVTYGTPGNPYEITSEATLEKSVNTLKSYQFYSDDPFKVRNGDGFSYVHIGTFDKVFARMQDNAKGLVSKETFIVSFHPCDMITCSLGYRWSSCQSWINIFTDFPSGYGTGSNYSGMYSRGDFQFLLGNGFIAYVPYEELPNVPQHFWAKLKRCLLWVGNDLDCMRQNMFYPGRPTGQEPLAFAKVIREYIQEICAPFNFSNGTIDWKVRKMHSDYVSYVEHARDFDKVSEEYVPNFGSWRYDDPIMAISYLNRDEDTPKKLIYASQIRTFDTGTIPASSSNAVKTFFYNYNSAHVCRVCGKTVRGNSLYCPQCASELIEHNGKQIHPTDLVTIKVDGVIKRFDITELDHLAEYVQIDDGTTVNFKQAYKVVMPSGVKYFKELPSFVKQCKVCNEYFHENFMIGDVCVSDFNSALTNHDDIELRYNLEDIIDSFLSRAISFDCNDTEKLHILLDMLAKHKVLWVSGKKANEFIPLTNTTKAMYLSLDKNKKLILSKQAKYTVIRLSNLVVKGGE